MKVSNFFICPGAQKAGTTTLHDLLCQHPQISLPKKKETKYFINADLMDREEYFSRFFAVQLNDVPGEIDPDYMFQPSVPEKLFNAFGQDVKIVFLLRNPVDRAYSHYWMSFRRGFETETFERAFELESTRLNTNDRVAFWHQSYFARGFYTQQIKRFLEYFNKENCLFIKFDDFVANRLEVLDTILSFLNVDNRYEFQEPEIKSNEAGLPKSRILSVLHGRPPSFVKYFKFLIPSRKFRWTVVYPMMEKINISKRKPAEMRPETRKQLLEYYTDELLHIQETAGIDTTSWRV